MKGFNVAEQGKPIAGLAPVDIGGVAKTTDYWSMENYQHVSILIYCGAITNAATITVFESDDLAASNETAIAFKYATMTAAGVTGALTACASTGFSTGTTNGSMFVIEIDSSELTADYPCMAVKTTNAGANVIAIIPVLSGARYAQSGPPNAIA